MTAAASAVPPSPAEPVEPAEIVARSEAMRDAVSAAEDVARTAATVLLLGEEGAGKALLARHIHRHSLHPDRAFVTVTCVALGPELAAGEIFGPEATSGGRRGAFDRARGGTLFLDRICELPAPQQARLVRILQESENDGSSPRVIASAVKDLAAMVRKGQFRADLYYRLDVFPIRVPPLRERPEDLEALVRTLAARTAAAHGRSTPALAEEAIAALAGALLPGNVRELSNIIERALVRNRGDEIGVGDLGLAGIPAPALAPPPGRPFPPGLPLHLETLERMAIEAALAQVRGNRTHAAKLLGIGLRTLRNKLRLWRLAEGAGEAEAAIADEVDGAIANNPAP